MFSRPSLKQPTFIPVTKAELKKIGWEQPDIILVSADAYVDHPSFPVAVLGRTLIDAGFSVAILNQPDWKDRSGKAFQVLGKPNLFFAVVPGAVDPMINSYTPALKKRSNDAYSPGGKLTRPDRVTIVYTNILHRLYPDIPIVIGGVEASLRRFAHYDYWTDSVRQALLADAPATLLVYGMGERQMIEIAEALSKKESIRGIHGTCYTVSIAEFRRGEISGTILPSYPDVQEKETFAHFWRLFSSSAGPFIQPHPKTGIIQNIPAEPLSSEELDRIYELPYMRMQHPSIKEKIPALEPIQFSVVTHRGCFGACSFCSITHHQGKRIISRSEESIIREIKRMVKMASFHGTISDIGGPSANMYGCHCKTWDSGEPCRNKTCIGCSFLEDGTERQLNLLKKIRELPKVKHAFISSGLRYDLIPKNKIGDEYLAEITQYHISGHMKVAPEHISPRVTALMNKPSEGAFEEFRVRFEEMQKGKQKRQYLVPYLMSSHPGCHVEDMVNLALYLRKHDMFTEQVQDFTPSPMTLSTAMYYSGINPMNGKHVYVPKGGEKRIQRAILQWKDPRQYDLVVSGLLKAGRGDLIGDLVPDRGIPANLHKKKR
ncbi:MAG TPA: YgiQ family radical SAM protein [Methanocorpusculum sp.]|nr:YgiQ family radical SAM protein [Methanocorpusculum sp.]